MNDKQKLAAIGAQYRLTEEQAKGLAERMPQTGALQVIDDEPLCMAKRIEDLEAQLEKLTNRMAWRNTGSPNGLRRFMTHKQYDAQTPGVQKWYEPIRYEAPEGWELVPVEPTEHLLPKGNSRDATYRRGGMISWWKLCRDVMIAAAPKPDTEHPDALVAISDIASLQRYTLGGHCDSFGQDCGAEMEPDDEGEYVLLSEALMIAAATSPDGTK